MNHIETKLKQLEIFTKSHKAENPRATAKVHDVKSISDTISA